ncbi:hypothetical protein BU24DRAFT_446954 [Aaosphaeria arxii CBS 175.79]|uniref:Uncharacterized protein n=1 Tax=Aaosphaeria arxii CBS 175.79 TaxID=1450172 RepID=A0A6A5YA09_9PLEO|nr:uncharacterized protein BU24DRAFT_446954 [Aaosphaeria arxii CBS 175.79]KAF2022086.1 hypothetical protein BU24DRAFT_446954 [Aaosphaeria arxii CBS 175.79]
MAPNHPHRASIRSFGSAHPPPSYDTRTKDDFQSQLEETTQRPPRSTRSKIISNVILAFTISLLLLSLALGILLCIAGTSSSTTNNKSKILLSDHNVLEIPIKYDFLCSPTESLRECTPEWFVRMYLDGVWAYHHDPNTPDTPSSLHQIHASPGKTFNLTSILTIMDSNIPLQSSQASQNYTIPTQPTLHLTTSAPISTLPTFAALLVSMSLTLLTTLLLAITPTILSTHQKRPFVLIFTLLPYIPLIAALTCNIFALTYLRTKASAVISQLLTDTLYSASPNGHPEAHLGSPFLTLSAISIGAQGLALFSHASYLYLSSPFFSFSRSPSSSETAEEDHHAIELPLSPLKDPKRASAASKKNDAPLSDEELIRMAELQTLETLQWRQSRDSISEISRQSFSRTPERRLSYVLEPPKRLVIGDEVFAAAGAGANGGGHVRRGSLSRTLTHDSV